MESDMYQALLALARAGGRMTFAVDPEGCDGSYSRVTKTMVSVLRACDRVAMVLGDREELEHIVLYVALDAGGSLTIGNKITAFGALEICVDRDEIWTVRFTPSGDERFSKGEAKLVTFEQLQEELKEIYGKK